MRCLLQYFSCFILLIGSASCGVNRRLQPGQQLYDGATIKVDIPQGIKTKTSTIEKKLKALATPKRNKRLFGKPYKVWWWYVIGQPKKEKGFKAWLRNTLGEPPVLATDLNPELNSNTLSLSGPGPAAPFLL